MTPQTVSPMTEAELSLAEREQIRRSRLLALLLSFQLPLDLLLLPSAFVPTTDPVALSALATAIVMGGCSILLNRKAKVETAAYLYLVSVITSCSLYLFFSPPQFFLFGVYIYSFFALAVVNSGFLLGRRAPFTFAILSACIVSTHVALHSHETLALPGFHDQPVYVLALIPDIILFMMALVAWLGAGSMEEALVRSVQADKLKLLNEQMQGMHEELVAGNTELEEANTKLEALATTDGLTGLKNHRTFQERLQEEVVRALRYNAPLSVMILDVDKFKAYNDTFGHPAGDAVLRRVAAALQETARSTDLTARYGGEEFAVILPEMDMEQARSAAERFRLAIAAVPWEERPITVSVGIATLTLSTADAAALIGEADKALYRSKQRSRNCTTHAQDTIEPLRLDAERLTIYADMVRQQIDLETQTLSGTAGAIESSILQSYDMTVRSWSRILDIKDKETEGHSKRVAEMMVRLARSIGMNEEEVLYAKWGAMLHDIGKMGVPDAILHKPGPLTDEEWVVMKSHPAIAFEMLSPITFLLPALEIPYCHHEKWDGTGYPRGLKGEEIPRSANLFAVIDVYDALRSDRPYREAWSEEKVRAYLQSQAGTHFDPRAVDAFLAMLDTNEPPVELTALAA